MTIRAFQCFASGSHTDMRGTSVTVTPARLQTIAVAYNAHKQTRPAPLVLGHPDSNDTSYGTVRALIAEGGALFAVAEVSFALLSLVRTGRYKNVSASFHLPGSKDNPVGNEWYLRHVGFLGAVPPAVRGMQPVSFSCVDDFASYSASVTAPNESRNEQIHRVTKDILRAAPGAKLIDVAIRIDRALPR